VDDDRPWLGEEPSARPDLTFRPVPTGIAVFTAVATPIAVWGLTWSGGPNGVVIAFAVLAGVVAGIAAGLGIERHGGEPPVGPRL
jgi:hypothetical protein